MQPMDLSERPQRIAQPQHPGYPFSAIVGSEDAKTALVLCAVDPLLSGVLLIGGPGSGKSITARSLASVLPGDAPFIEIPLQASIEQLSGSLHRSAAGTVVRPGIVSGADGGVVYVAEVNRIDSAVANWLTQVARMQTNRLSDADVAVRETCRFVLLGSMDPSEGPLRPAIADRFGLSAHVSAPSAAFERAEIVRRAVAFERDPYAFVREWTEQERELSRRIDLARPAEIADQILEPISRLCVALGATGMRSDLLLARAAAARAGWLGRRTTTEDDLAAVAPLVLPHRRMHAEPPGLLLDQELHSALRDVLGGAAAPVIGAPAPFSVDEPATTHTSADLSSGALIESASAQGETDSADTGARSSGAQTPDNNGSQEAALRRALQGPTGNAVDLASTHLASAGVTDSGAEFAITQPEAALELDVDRETMHGEAATAGSASGAAAASSRAIGPLDTRSASLTSSGESTGNLPPVSISHEPARADRSDTDAPRSERIVEISLDDPTDPVRFTDRLAPLPLRRHDPAELGHLLVLCVDTSAGASTAERIRAVRLASLAYLDRAYARRDQLAVVCFSGDRADVVLRPTTSVEVARARLAEIPTAAGAPLAAGIDAAVDVAAQPVAVDGVHRPVLVLISSGESTPPPDSALTPGTSEAAALLAADRVARRQMQSVVIDTAPGGARSGARARHGKVLAARMSAMHLTMPELSPESLTAALMNLTAEPLSLR